MRIIEDLVAFFLGLLDVLAYGMTFGWGNST